VHLAYALLGGPYGTVVLVDAAPVDGPPGTVAVLEVDTAPRADAAGAGADAVPPGGPAFPPAADPGARTPTGPALAGDGHAAGSATATVAPPADPLPAPAFDAHGLDPASVLALLRGLGGHVDRVLVVGCRPASLQEGMSLSEPVAASVEMAARLTVELARNEAAALARAGERRNR
jgi:hydrogenase maturation protease